ncbi:VSP with INR [Giardia lamblia P15]|uniref:VSP with INR n=1 Tax=Giardia intestinalis (strain P15) TaxID=658858 RepID=E1F9I2_GIAIA|nr:VSP with INR [Giardia lamblia P15]
MLVVLLLICINVLAKYSGRETCEPATGVCDGSLSKAGCATCTAAGSDQTCLSCTTSSHKIRPDEKGCIAACPEGVSTDVDGFCECKNGYQPSASGETCELDACNTPNCKACDNPKTDREVCTECNDGNYLTPTSQCVPDCTVISGYYGDADKKCKKCHDACTECIGAASNQCSACPAGMMLQYTNTNTPAYGGTCVDQCSVSATTEGCAECGARIGGTDYCSKCKGGQVSVDGVCAANTKRNVICTTLSDGVCSACTEGYFLFAGGCYKTGQQPGKQVCSNAVGGKCTKCASGIDVVDGDCSTRKCHESCETCTTANDPNACTTCNTGYYKPQKCWDKVQSVFRGARRVQAVHSVICQCVHVP